MKPLDLTTSGIIRALTTVDDAIRAKAEALADELAKHCVEVRVEADGPGNYTVVASGDELFAHEFGGTSSDTDGSIGAAIENIKTGGAVE